MADPSWLGELDLGGDQVLLRIGVAAGPGQEPDTVWVDAASASLTAAELSEMLALRVSEQGHESAYRLRLRQDATHWGADASTTDILLDIAQDVGSVAYIAELVHRAFRRLNKDRTPRHPITRWEAEERARWAVDVSFGQAHREVTRGDHDRETGTWVLELEDEGEEYRVEIGLFSDLPSVVRIERRMRHRP